MNVIAFILGIVAVVLFVFDGVRTKAPLPWGLAAFAAMVMAQWLIGADDLITL